MTGSLCDRCRAPGRCCSGFHLGGGHFGRGKTALEVLVDLASAATWTEGGGPRGHCRETPPAAAEDVQLGLPFLPLWVDSGGYWRFWCPLLGPGGRCTQYERRPALCRSYEAGSDSLCAMASERPAAAP